MTSHYDRLLKKNGFCRKRLLTPVCRRLHSAQDRVKILFRLMFTFAYAGARFVSQRKRVSKSARDDVSRENARAERVGRILAWVDYQIGNSLRP
jgi:hypothetical protein